MTKIRSHDELEVFQMAFHVAMEIFELTKAFPTIEKYSLIDQIRRSSRSVWKDSENEGIQSLSLQS